jgi:hypothetical protein
MIARQPTHSRDTPDTISPFIKKALESLQTTISTLSPEEKTNLDGDYLFTKKIGFDDWACLIDLSSGEWKIMMFDAEDSVPPIAFTPVHAQESQAQQGIVPAPGKGKAPVSNFSLPSSAYRT